MSRRVSFNNVESAIRCLEEDGGVILTNFVKEKDVQTVNDDAAPFIKAVAEEVCIET